MAGPGSRGLSPLIGRRSELQKSCRRDARRRSSGALHSMNSSYTIYGLLALRGIRLSEAARKSAKVAHC
ncbi:hypothetical protein CSUI_008596 [Cystoisospora suis]|uniref:Uncharacterized protein n=1 Tax=Cystoisospora suis TaxID=483139 RepID=A0A2C6K8G5_9APIC|nr:hypothetical protein CSUI_008596 [Cystoisospora suis]